MKTNQIAALAANQTAALLSAQIETSTSDSPSTVEAKPKAREAIPLEAFIGLEGFAAEYTQLMKETGSDKTLTAAFTEILVEGAKKALAFSPKRKKGAITKSTERIRKLVEENKSLSAKELWNILSDTDKSTIGDMSSTTFANNVSAARQALNLPKPKKARTTNPSG